MQSLRDFYDMLDGSQWWSPEQLLAWQRQHLTLLLNHARASTRFYRLRLNRIFRPNGGVDWDRWHELPILTRSDVLNYRESLLSRTPIPAHGPYQDVQSSGSTGHPVNVRVSAWMMRMSSACNWRTQQWSGLDWSKTLLSTGNADPRRLVGDNIGPWGPPWLANAERGRTIYSHYQTEIDDRLRLIAEHKVAYHATTPPAAQRVAEQTRLHQSTIRLDAILMRGGSVTSALRDDLMTTLGARTVEFYSSKECGAIGQRCPYGDGYHVNAEAVLLEVVDENGVPVAPGESGRAVITPFASTALPLIRYAQGDIIVAGGTCSCGRTLPHFAAISGRERTFFLHPSGRRRDTEFTQECRELIGAGQVQVAQIGPTLFEIRYTPHDWGVPRDEARFLSAFRKIVFDDAQVVLSPMETIPLSASGKFLAAVVEWRPDGGTALGAETAPRG